MYVITFNKILGYEGLFLFSPGVKFMCYLFLQWVWAHIIQSCIVKYLSSFIPVGHDAPEAGWFAGLQTELEHVAAIQQTSVAVVEPVEELSGNSQDDLGEPSPTPTSHVATYSQTGNFGCFNYLFSYALIRSAQNLHKHTIIIWHPRIALLGMCCFFLFVFSRGGQREI